MCFTATTTWANQCLVSSNHSSITPFTLKYQQSHFDNVPKGNFTLTFECQLSQQSVLSFVDVGLKHFAWQQSADPLQAIKYTNPAYIIPAGSTTLELNAQAIQPHSLRLKLYSMPSFVVQSQKNSLIMGAFYGLCFTLICYVMIIGSRLNDSIFRLYGAYILCLCGFVLFQEGQLNLFIAPQYKALLKHFYLLCIGLTVVTATWFMTSILAVAKVWPNFTKLLKLAAALVLLLAISKIAVSQDHIDTLLNRLMGYLTLAIVATIFILAALQTRRRVEEANLVFAALSLVLVGMVFRILLVGYSPFMQRYALVFAFAIESLLLAIAVSKRLGRLKQQKQQAENEANFDQLCGIYNRRGWEKSCTPLLEQQKLDKSVLALFYIDLDKFKQINDEHGHDVGDLALQSVAKLLTANTRDGDVVGRLGGDEFVVACLFKDKTAAKEKAEQLQQQINALSISDDNNTIDVQGSVGVALSTSPGDDLTALLQQADDQMYKIKQQHRATQAK